ncbi:hypothetical protein [Steroidobacter cummioxidans]|uniref:hypothetical protein n=1 Tax=Steroidobacter cummioxidans TaxID=1803913 RepID=UPI000E30C8D9|nr:hypothetical protein [Steroidobacter cummioxidans]
MNIRLTSLQRRLTAAVAVACTLAAAVSPALADGRWGLLLPYQLSSPSAQLVLIPHSGVPHGIHNGFAIVAAPIGAFVPWYGGLPYYYADDAYRMWTSDPNAYEVVSPPPGAPAPVVNSDQPYAYPLEDQSPEQQARDRYDCHAWAVEESGFDPSQSGDDMTATLTAYYNLALSACLKGRGYSVQ